MSLSQPIPRWIKVSAAPPILKHMIYFGLIGGLLFGFIGQFIVRKEVENLLLEFQRIPEEYGFQIMKIEILAMVLGLAVLILLLRFYWQAPSIKAKFAHGFSVGFVFVLAAHLFIGSINGALYSHDLWRIFYQPYSTEDPTFLNMLVEAVWYTISEGMSFQIIALILIPLAGGFLGLLLLRRDLEPNLPEVKDMFGSFAACMLPLAMYLIMITNAVIFAVLGDVLMDTALENGATIFPYELVTAIMVVPPLVMLIIFQVLSILWLMNAEPRTLHGSMLRVSQVVTVLLMGIGVFPFMQFISPGMMTTSALSLYMIVFSMVLAWAYGILAEVKLRAINPKRDIKVRARWGSLIKISMSMFLLTFLLAHFFSLSIPLNMVLYVVQMMPIEAGQPTVTISEMLGGTTIGVWVSTLMPIGGIGLIYMTVTLPFLWFANGVEK